MKTYNHYINDECVEQCGSCQCLTGLELLHVFFESGAWWSLNK